MTALILGPTAFCLDGDDALLRAAVALQAENVQLLREWLQATIKPGMTITVPDEAAANRPVPMRIVALPAGEVVVDTYKTRNQFGELDDQKHFFTIQPLEEWLGPAVKRNEKEVFIVSDPDQVDLLAITGTTLTFVTESWCGSRVGQTSKDARTYRIRALWFRAWLCTMSASQSYVFLMLCGSTGG